MLKSQESAFSKIHELLLHSRQHSVPKSSRRTFTHNEIVMLFARYTCFFYEITHHADIFNFWLTRCPKFQKLIDQFSENLNIMLNENDIKFYKNEVLDGLMNGNITNLMIFLEDHPYVTQYLSRIWVPLYEVIVAWEKSHYEVTKRIKFVGFKKDKNHKELIEYLVAEKSETDLACLFDLVSIEESNYPFLLAGIKEAVNNSDEVRTEYILNRCWAMAHVVRNDFVKALMTDINDKKTIDEVVSYFEEGQKGLLSDPCLRVINNYSADPAYLVRKLGQLCLEKSQQLLAKLDPQTQETEKKKIVLFDPIKKNETNWPEQFFGSVEIDPDFFSVLGKAEEANKFKL